MAATEKLMSTRELADYLGVPLATLYGWNSRGVGPRRFAIGRVTRYRRSDVDAWLAAHTIEAPDATRSGRYVLVKTREA